MILRIVIPARLGSSRLPGKMLEKIGGESLVRMAVRRVVEAVRLVDFDVHALLATDSADIAAEAGGLLNTLITPSDCRSGTDRVAAAAEMMGWPDDAIVVNVQADMPFLDPRHLAGFFKSGMSGGIWDVLTAFCDLRLVRAGVDAFTRDAVPSHVGLYAYKRAALRRFAALPTSDGERRLSLEQLRAAEAGFALAYHALPAMPFEINTAEDLGQARVMAKCFEVAA